MRAPITVHGDMCSVTGRKGKNEDYALVSPTLGACLADGIGGELMGGVFARCACKTAMRAMAEGKTATQSIACAHTYSIDLACNLDCGRGGAALCVVRCDASGIELAWAGDVICLLLQADGQKLTTLTKPDRGRRGVTNAVGMRMQAHSKTFSLNEGDRLLLCSDGVWEGMDSAAILDALREARTPREAAVRLVIGRDHEDDATAVVLFADRSDERETKNLRMLKKESSL